MERGRSKAGFRRFYAYAEEVGLKEPLSALVARHESTLFAIYMDEPTVSATAARLEVWWYLVTETGRSAAEVAELFDRNRSSVVHGLRLLKAKAEQLTVRVAPDTIGVLARLVAGPRRREPS